jgi:hypothetical protein
MDFGIFTMFTVREDGTQAEAFREWFGIVQAAEEMGLDTFWIGESHFRPERAVMSAPLIGASAVAARTERIKVGLAVQMLPLANPMRLAEETTIRQVAMSGDPENRTHNVMLIREAGRRAKADHEGESARVTKDSGLGSSRLGRPRISSWESEMLNWLALGGELSG